jgi:predicted nucleotidyltransferase component of viral defense system
MAGKQEKVNQVIQDMLSAYPMKTPDDQKKALLEVLQEIILCSLFQAGFFSVAAFYGGSALRILHQLDRFSEDLDFSLLHKDEAFKFDKYFSSLKQHSLSFGFEMAFSKKEKNLSSQIQSAFLKGNTLQHFIQIFPRKSDTFEFAHNDSLKIKMEVDAVPPLGASYELKYLLNPLPSAIRTYDLPSLFASKIHALLCRTWKKRVKGRDFFDYIWFLSKNIPVNLYHLEQRLRQNHFLPEEESFTKENLIKFLGAKFAEVDFEQAKKDIRPFIPVNYDLSLWSSSFFTTITQDKLKVTE